MLSWWCGDLVPGLGQVLARAARAGRSLAIELVPGRACNQAEPLVWWPGAGPWSGAGQSDARAGRTLAIELVPGRACNHAELVVW